MVWKISGKLLEEIKGNDEEIVGEIVRKLRNDVTNFTNFSWASEGFDIQNSSHIQL